MEGRGWAMFGRSCRAANHARRARGPVLFCLRLLREFDRMTDSHQIVMRRSMILWIGTALLIAFNLFAASQHSFALTYAALAATGVFALFAIGFGIWAARMVTRRPVSGPRSEEHTSELQSLMRISYAVFCLNKKK